MRSAWGCALSVTGLLLLAAPHVARMHEGPGCSTSAGMKDASKHTKPSSFAPHARAAHNAYGAPIGDKILTKRLKKKKPTPEPG